MYFSSSFKVSNFEITENFLKDFIYLFLEREEGKEKERERETSMWGCLSHAPHWRPGPQPGHVP